ncbi:MAG: peptide chain release factor N(5)-glutamine methyltransferase [Gammaproteobacteria bacterium]|nr:peptide chain release factor N(5)-glutamine methyltransferase [Gammaproteobacteria bacterium]
MTTSIRILSARLALASDTPSLDAEIILAYVLGVARSQICGEPELRLDHTQERALQALVERRMLGEPIAYLVGEKEFWSLKFKVLPSVLIPRSETETLVETCLHIVTYRDETLEVADLGTGCGAIAVALAKERSNWNITATDCSLAALEIAKENRERHAPLKIQFYQGDWCQALPHAGYDVILSNPPYIAEYEEGEGISYEPKIALFSKEEGYCELFKIIESSWDVLKPNGWLLLEHGWSQQPKLMKALASRGYSELQGYCDLAGHPRVVVGRKRSG